MVDFSIVLPAKNEAGGIGDVLARLVAATEGLSREIVVVNDYSTDDTKREACSVKGPIVVVDNTGARGIGGALQYGLRHVRGRWTAFIMSDGSEAPKEVRAMCELALSTDADAVFADRWSGASVKGYPLLKRLLNRLGNHLVAVIVRRRFTDWTNVVKLYRTSLLAGLSVNSPGYEIGLEMSLKAVALGAHYQVIPMSWTERKNGVSKLRLVANSRACLGVLWREANLKRKRQCRS